MVIPQKSMIAIYHHSPIHSPGGKSPRDGDRESQASWCPNFLMVVKGITRDISMIQDTIVSKTSCYCCLLAPVMDIVLLAARFYLLALVIIVIIHT